MSESSFRPIAERELQLRGPAERIVRLRIGTPEPDPKHKGGFRCPYQVLGLSDDAVQFAHGVDSFQALNLAFSGIRNAVRTNAKVLAAFHDDFSLTWDDASWETAIPVWIDLWDADQAQRLESFLVNELWATEDGDDEGEPSG